MWYVHASTISPFTLRVSLYFRVRLTALGGSLQLTPCNQLPRDTFVISLTAGEEKGKRYTKKSFKIHKKKGQNGH